MDRSNRRLTKAAMAGVVLIGAGAAGAAEPTVEELKAQVQELSKKVSALETKQAVNSADAQATIEQVLRDAEHRSQLMAAGGNLVGGWNAEKKQFYLGSEDGDFYFHPGVLLQFRNAANFRDNAKNGNGDFQDGFEVRRPDGR